MIKILKIVLALVDRLCEIFQFSDRSMVIYRWNRKFIFTKMISKESSTKFDTRKIFWDFYDFVIGWQNTRTYIHVAGSQRVSIYKSIYLYRFINHLLSNSTVITISSALMFPLLSLQFIVIYSFSFELRSQLQSFLMMMCSKNGLYTYAIDTVCSFSIWLCHMMYYTIFQETSTFRKRK